MLVHLHLHAPESPPDRGSEACLPLPVHLACVLPEVGAWGRLAAPGAEICPAPGKAALLVQSLWGHRLVPRVGAVVTLLEDQKGRRGPQPVQEPRPSSALLCASPTNVTASVALSLGIRGPVVR